MSSTTTSPRNLRTNWNIPVTFQRQTKTRRGLTLFHSKLREVTKADRHDPRSSKPYVRVANVRRLTSGGNVRFKIIGIENPIEGSFEEMKDTLRAQKFTAIRWAGRVVKL